MTTLKCGVRFPVTAASCSCHEKAIKEPNRPSFEDVQRGAYRIWMTFEEALEVAKGLPGRMIDVSIWVSDNGRDRTQIVGFAGVVASVTDVSHSYRRPNHWRIALEREGQPKPEDGHFVLDETTFEGAETGSGGLAPEVVNEIADLPDLGAAEWVFTIRHLGAITDVTVWVAGPQRP